MPRPMKCRKVCQMPRTREFHPAGGSPRKEAVVLTVDEYEAVRLIDRQGFSQEECSAYMQVARSTVQSIYNSARKNWRRPWWTGGLCGSRAGTISSVTGVRSTAAAAAAGGTVWPVWVGQSKEDVTIKIAVPLDENGQDVSWPGPPASCSGRTRRTWCWRTQRLRPGRWPAEMWTPQPALGHPTEVRASGVRFLEEKRWRYASTSGM